MVIHQLMFVFRLHEAPQIGEVPENEPKRRYPQRLVVLGFFHLDLRVDFFFPTKPLLGRERAIVESVVRAIKFLL